MRGEYISIDQSEALLPVHHEVFVVQAPPALFGQSSAALHSITFHLDFLQGNIKRPSNQSGMSVIRIDQSEIPCNNPGMGSRAVSEEEPSSMVQVMQLGVIFTLKQKKRLKRVNCALCLDFELIGLDWDLSLNITKNLVMCPISQLVEAQQCGHTQGLC